jgi:hypothetical protein
VQQLQLLAMGTMRSTRIAWIFGGLSALVLEGYLTLFSQSMIGDGTRRSLIDAIE